MVRKIFKVLKKENKTERLTAAKRDCWFSLTGNSIFTKNVLSWQRKLSPLESQPRLSRETLCDII